ncbi:hypothetical protein O9992_12825 [Vibrio lentus]|nr:hypothetical protein [Vibrio lentus]
MLDTVTAEARLAIALAQEGRNRLHSLKNMSIEQQAEMVRQLKLQKRVVSHPCYCKP